MIVGINGVSESGKDSIGTICQKVWGCRRIAFADRMKEFALAVDPWVWDPLLRHAPERLSSLVKRVGWDEAKKHPEVRRLLQRIGTEGGRKTLDEDLWIKQAFPNGVRGKHHYVVTDVRFFNEAEYVRKNGGIVVRVERPGYGPALGHVSDVHDEGLWDTVIFNDGTLSDLHMKTVAVLQNLFL